MRKKLRVVAVMLVAVLLVVFTTPISTLAAIVDGDEGELSSNVDLLGGDVGGVSVRVNYNGCYRSVYRGEIVL